VIREPRGTPAARDWMGTLARRVLRVRLVSKDPLVAKVQLATRDQRGTRALQETRAYLETQGLSVTPDLLDNQALLVSPVRQATPVQQVIKDLSEIKVPQGKWVTLDSPEIRAPLETREQLATRVLQAIKGQ
jgi:hypothetical protein